MLVPGSVNPLLAFTSAAAGYQISRSLRFNSSDSAYLSRTPASAGNRKTWTWSGWVKRSALSATEAESTLFSGGGGANDSTIVFVNNQLFYYYYASPGGYLADVRSIAVFRDLSAWYHIVVAVDTTQATASNRVRLYVNGSEVSYSSPTYPSQNLDMGINTVSTVHTVGVRNTLFNYLSGYLADIHFIDGQALTPSSFGQTDANGEWQPIAYTGTYGTNGFKLNFADNSAATAAALGKDTSPNGNNWTPNNLSVTAGAGNDSLVDTPTSYGTDTGVGGEVRGNYCTWNPLSGSLALSNGNLEVPGGSAYANRRGTVGVSAGKWYVEFTLAPGQTATSAMVGWYDTDSTAATYTTGKGAWYYSANGGIYVDGVNTGNTTAANPGDIIGMSLDADTRQVKVYLNNTLLSTKTVGVAGGYTPVVFAQDAAYGAVLNAGQRPFAYTAPSGFKALCDTNLPAPVVAKPSTVMDVKLYTGTGSALTATSSLGFSPDFVWIKGRSGATDHALYDAVRGATLDLVSNSTAAETTQTQGLTAFNSNGFNVGTLAKVNTSSATYAAWCWDAGSSNVVNTQGSITSTVRANPSAGFSIVTYTGTGSTGSVGHGLGVAPSMIILKNRDTTANWLVYHSSRRNGYNPQQNMLFLNSAGIGGTGNAYPWDNTAPTSTVFSIGGGDYGQMTSGTKIVAYCFAPVAGYSSGFSYTGNGSTDGVFVYLGLRAKLLLIKRTDTTGNWYLWDTVRNTYNVVGEELYPNLSNAAATATDLDILSNGFKMRSTAADFNASGGTYVGFAWAEAPFAYSRAR